MCRNISFPGGWRFPYTVNIIIYNDRVSELKCLVILYWGVQCLLLLLKLEELLKFAVHDFDCFVSSFNNCLEQLACLGNGNLGLELFLLGQILKCSVEIVPDFCINLRNDIFFFVSDQLNKFQALLSTQWSVLNFAIHFQSCIIPFIFSAPYRILSKLNVALLPLICLFDSLLWLGEPLFVYFDLFVGVKIFLLLCADLSLL